LVTLIILNKEKPQLSDLINANRSFIMVLLCLPVIGMLITAGLIIYKKPENMKLILGILSFARALQVRTAVNV
jgi:hypothetical protein